MLSSKILLRRDTAGSARGPASPFTFLFCAKNDQEPRQRQEYRCHFIPAEMISGNSRIFGGLEWSERSCYFVPPARPACAPSRAPQAQKDL